MRGLGNHCSIQLSYGDDPDGRFAGRDALGKPNGSDEVSREEKIGHGGAHRAIRDPAASNGRIFRAFPRLFWAGKTFGLAIIRAVPFGLSNGSLTSRTS